MRCGVAPPFAATSRTVLADGMVSAEGSISTAPPASGTGTTFGGRPRTARSGSGCGAATAHRRVPPDPTSARNRISTTTMPARATAMYIHMREHSTVGCAPSSTAAVLASVVDIESPSFAVFLSLVSVRSAPVGGDAPRHHRLRRQARPARSDLAIGTHERKPAVHGGAAPVHPAGGPRFRRRRSKFRCVETARTTVRLRSDANRGPRAGPGPRAPRDARSGSTFRDGTASTAHSRCRWGSVGRRAARTRRARAARRTDRGPARPAPADGAAAPRPPGASRTR